MAGEDQGLAAGTRALILESGYEQSPEKWTLRKFASYRRIETAIGGKFYCWERQDIPMVICGVKIWLLREAGLVINHKTFSSNSAAKTIFSKQKSS